ncbi:hypothetical protein FAZ69_28065 [Trinickia terrae]|uniref:Cellulose biosynthesis protein BcsR n=1 Tax=Trinickia terrae TaxID=2571161 RepID=A0A4U1HN31_9BURK|nr:cellulose biosynthesis protein BcsP [Trinickia terrae]TKC81478.1 hypothetical protein FAZ69_28065 [Trinickia terrae]
MSVSDDIGNLFKKFGGNADAYQEVARDDDSQIARARWPLLATLDVEQHQSVPTVTLRSAATPVQIKAPPPAANTVRPASRLPLFGRAHRHATHPVQTVAAPPRLVGAPRFAPTPEEEEEAAGEERAAEAQQTAPRPAPAAPLTASGSGLAGTFGAKAAGSASPAPSGVAATPPSGGLAAVFGRAAAARPAASAAPAANSILGQLFQSAAPEPATKAGLSTLFRRLEGSRKSEPEPASGNVLGRARFDLPRKPS